MKFYGEALGAGIKPIIGADVYVRTESGNEDYFELTLLAKNNKGYHNITQILSKAYQQGYVEFPMVEREWLAELNEGIIILSGGRMGDVGKALLKENRQEAEEKLAFYQQYYPNHFTFPFAVPDGQTKNAISNKRSNFHKKCNSVSGGK